MASLGRDLRRCSVIDQAAGRIHLQQNIHCGVFEGLVGADKPAKLNSAGEVADNTVEGRGAGACGFGGREQGANESHIFECLLGMG